VGNTPPQITITPVATVTLPVLTVNLHATVTDDGAPYGIVSTVWSKVSDNCSVTFGDVNALNTTATFTTNGTYVLRLTASDGALSSSSSVTAVVNGPPEITSPPAATNKLAQVDDRSVVAGYDPTCFTVGVFDPDFNPLYCQWDFGDSGISTDCDPCHVFTNCGVHAVSVVVSDGIASTNATSTVVVACELYITKLRIKLNFAKTNSDSCTLAGAFDPGTGLDLTNKVVTINVGGAQVPFTMDAKGKGKGVSHFGSCKLAYKKKAGLWILKVKLAKGTWRTQWLEHGLSNATISKPGASVNMPVVVVIDTNAFADERSMVYTATKNQSGTAK
jgi:PKD repeat protein